MMPNEMASMLDASHDSWSGDAPNAAGVPIQDRPDLHLSRPG
jgi:hypothetical protein